MPTTEAMKDIIVKIMVEVFGIFGIVTKEMKQGRTSELIHDDALRIADRNSEKYLKKLIGRRDIEDALGRLDRLTQEEARMATAQVLKVAHRVEHGVECIGGQVKGVGDQVTGVARRVTGLGGQVIGVNSQVMVVGEQVKGVDNKVKDVDNKLNTIVEGTFNTLTQMSS